VVATNTTVTSSTIAAAAAAAVVKCCGGEVAATPPSLTTMTTMFSSTYHARLNAQQNYPRRTYSYALSIGYDPSNSIRTTRAAGDGQPSATDAASER